jgi:hypothetical protein
MLHTNPVGQEISDKLKDHIKAVLDSQTTNQCPINRSMVDHKALWELEEYYYHIWGDRPENR